MRVLMVEADRSTAQMLHFELRARWRSVVILFAGDGQQALLLAQSDRNSLIILDMDLPDMDGLKVLRAIRGSSQVPIIALGRDGNRRERNAVMEAGADGYVPEPFSSNDLIAQVQSLLLPRVSGVVPASSHRMIA